MLEKDHGQPTASDKDIQLFKLTVNIIIIIIIIYYYFMLTKSTWSWGVWEKVNRESKSGEVDLKCICVAVRGVDGSKKANISYSQQDNSTENLKGIYTVSILL